MSADFLNSDEYQAKIAAEYALRISTITPQQVLETLHALGIHSVELRDITKAEIGNVNATFITPTLVIKMHDEQSERNFLPNKIVSDILGGTTPVVKVIAYDYFDKAPFETLVMERAPGTTLLKAMPTYSPEMQRAYFAQIFEVVHTLFSQKNESFGNINSSALYPTYADYLRQTFDANCQKIAEEQLCPADALTTIREYFHTHVHVCAEDSAVFTHADLHFGNIMHDGGRITAVIDFDHSLWAPAYRALVPLIGCIDNPSQFVEGTPDYALYAGKDFRHALPLCKESFREILSDPHILRKLNMQSIRDSVDLVAANWSDDLNAHMIKLVLEHELAHTSDDLRHTYYARAVA